MDPRQQKAILQLAVERGLLRERDLAGLPEDGALDTLVRRGRLTPETIGELERSMGGATTLPPSRDYAGERVRPVSSVEMENEPTVPWEESGATEEQSTARTFALTGEQTTQTQGARPDVHVAEAHSLDTGTELGRYRITAFLGAGGMGEVYKAHDATLDRPVALKFLKGAEPEMVQRFFREARAQARLTHEHICNVYEAGEIEQRPYIAMQFIPGHELGDIAPQLRLEQRVRLLSQVAMAVHSAHREGLVHRDLKPGNVMVEQTPDGDHKPYVMDFGLVRDERDPGVTRTGAMMGTPAYVAPEQAMGEQERIDRRTDVYGLGATLYALLLGRPPFQADNPLMHLYKVIEEEPVPPRTEDPTIPADLETITLKCLEKQPQARYDSARALSEDLERFLDGEPIEARPIGRIHRLLKRARKHRRVVALGAVAVGLLLALAVTAVVGRVQGVQQARLAQQFGQDTSYIELRMRAVHLSPPHDIRGEVAQLEQRMADIEARIGEIGAIAEGPGHQALGRGYLALGEIDLAREQLQVAWDAGVRDPDLAFSLGLATARVYQRERWQAESEPDAIERERERRRAQLEYGDPAAEYLSQGLGSASSLPEYVEGLLALVEKRYDDGIAHARAAWARDPLFYEALLLLGDLHREQRNELWDEGQLGASIDALDRAQRAYMTAADVGESDPVCYERLCEIVLARIGGSYTGASDLAALTAEIESLTTEVEDWGARGLVVDPDRARLHALLSRAARTLAAHQRDYGIDPSFSAAKAATTAARAARLAPADAEGYLAHGQAYLGYQGYLAGRGSDPSDAQAAAIRALELAAAIEPEAAANHAILGDAHLARAEHEWSRGGEPTPAWDRAVAAYQQAIELDPDRHTYLVDLANVIVYRAQYAEQHGADPFDLLQQAEQLLSRSLQIKPDDVYTLGCLGTVLSVRADMELARGRDPRPTLQRADEPFGAAMAAMPLWEHPHLGQIWLCYTAARFAWLEGRDPATDLDRMEGHVQRVLDLDPSSSDAFFYRGMGYMLRARYALDGRRTPERALERARSNVDRATDLDPADADFQCARAEVELLSARGLAASGRDPSAAHDAARAAAALAMSLDPGDAEIICVSAEIELRAAQWARTTGANSAATITRGVELADEALSIDADLAQAHAVRGSLLALHAGSDGGELRGAAADALRRALDLDPLLQREYGPVLDPLD